MLASSIVVLSTSTPAVAWEPAASQQQRSVPGATIPSRAVPVPKSPTGQNWSPPALAMPGPTDAVVAVAAATKARIGTTPLTVGSPAGGGPAPARVRVQVFDRKVTAAAGVDGLLARLTSAATAGKVSLDVDYSGFRSLYGGDWASRLHLVRLPGCALTTPELAQCQTQEPLADHNDLQAGRITADVPTPGADTVARLGAGTDAGVVALAATAAGGSGDYTATSLSPSATWQVSTQTGAFTWSYPMRTPPVPGDLDVDLALSYSSGSVDGEIATTNNQTSWIGQGFNLSPGFIERRYGSCIDDGVSTKPGDLCWGGDYVSVSFGSRATELIRDDASGQWKLREDDGTRVEHLTGAANGAQGGEYWKLTTPDGTQYFFGRNRLPGWVAGKAETNSTWTVPVFGDDAGEPCHQSTFAASWCQQAYRWNLDHVVDVHGNALAHYYVKEMNYYGRNITASAGTEYVRGGYLTRTEYGLRSGAEYTTPALAMVSYTVAERCLRTATECAEANITAHPEFWPDVPADRICNAGAACTGKFSPTFFSRKRLASVTTKVRSGTTYTDVERWDLQQTFPVSGDGLSPSLWLNKIVHVGLVGGTLAQ
ncbi:MAG TPA: hypothetical protein VL179_05375, partial [Mycobacterium sp.]|nr:hypothetical protein [Mycobacterium sp.]